jgi:hypothetical protein
MSAELLDQLGSAAADGPVAALDLGLAGGNPRRRLLVRSKGHVVITLADHDGPPSVPGCQHRIP